MGISREEYIMVGVDINDILTDEFIERLEYDNLLRYKVKEGEEFCLLDGMNGDYTVLGEVVAVGDEYEGLSPTSMTMEEFNIISQRVKKLLLKYSIDETPKIYIMTHWYQIQ